MSLKEIRKRIDFIDSEILELLNDRMQLALMAKKLKSQIEDQAREKEVLDKLKMNSTGLINANFIEKIYTEIIEESKDLQERDHQLTAFQGEHGAFSEVASREWNSDLIPVPCGEFSQVFEGVESGLFDYGIVPVENTLGGSVDQVNRLLISTDLHVIGAVELAIHLCLLALPETDHKEIRAVYSHPRPLHSPGTFSQGTGLIPSPIPILPVRLKC